MIAEVHLVVRLGKIGGDQGDIRKKFGHTENFQVVTVLYFSVSLTLSSFAYYIPGSQSLSSFLHNSCMALPILDLSSEIRT